MTVFLDSSDAGKMAGYIGDDLYSRQRATRHQCVPVEEKGFFLAFCYCDINDALKDEERILIYCDGASLVFLGDNEHCRSILKKLPEDASPFKTLSEFFFSLTAGDMDSLENIETEVSFLEDSLLEKKDGVKNIGAKIIMLRRRLLRIKRYYEQLDLIVDRLAENENGCIPCELLPRFTSLGRRVDRLTESVVHLREFVTQLREAYQAQIDIEQNQIMKLFTVITAVFLPLTLIVGWYGMNFKMPEYEWENGYFFVVALSIAVCVVTVLLIKRKKWY